MNFLAAMGLAAVLNAAALGQTQTFVVDPNASKVTIALKTTHELVNGTFHIQAGSIEFDRTSNISGSLVVSTVSGNTGNSSRDKKMQRDILKVDQFAAVSFEPKSYVGTITPSVDSAIKVAGIFTLLGMHHEITIPMTVHVEGTTATVKAEFIVPYVQWGLKNPSFLIWKSGQ